MGERKLLFSLPQAPSFSAFERKKRVSLPAGSDQRLLASGLSQAFEKA
jgi:hypothetical protein